MPKKRNISWSRNKKEKQIITTRLMEISLKVEDYIYKFKPISEGEAEQYAREVSSYKLQCSGDERSLQVIEKLTRCMKAIILDHQELGTFNDNMQNATSIQDAGDLTGCISPVYSIPDEDRTQFTQIAEPRPINVTVANQDIEIVDLSNIGDDDLMYNDTSPTNTDCVNSRITVEADIHREMYSLSLRDAADLLNITATDVNCSQSILHNFEGVEQIQQNEINIVSHGAVTGELVGKGDKEKSIDITKAGGLSQIPNNNTTSIIEPHKAVKTNSVQNKPAVSVLANTNKINKIVQNNEPSKEINTYNNPLITSNEKDNTISSHTFYVSANNIPETQRLWYDSNRTCSINDFSHTLKDVNDITQPSQIHKVVNQVSVKNKANLNSVEAIKLNAAEKENQPFTAAENSKILINDTAIVPENSVTTKKKRGPRKKKIIDENETKPKTKRVYRAPKSNKENTSIDTEKNKLIPIYNENVVNDLSWMENIRYVREIRVDENDPKLNLEESFWDNCYLPANWSENEFL